MKKSFLLVILIAAALLVYQIVIVFFTKSHNIEYAFNIEGETLDVIEKYQTNKDDAYYLIELKYKDANIIFDTDDEFNKRKQIINDFYIYDKDSVICLSPVYVKEYRQESIYCSKEGKQASYESLKGDLDIEQLKSLASFNESSYISNLNKANEDEDLIYYVQNAKRDEHIAIYRYKYLAMYNEAEQNHFNISEKDVYINKLGVFINEYFAMPIYSDKNTIKGYHIVNITNNIRRYVLFNEEISLNTYVQGTDGNKVYLIDKTNKTQYALDLDESSYEKVSNSNQEALFYNGTDFEKLNIQSLINEEKLFSNKIVANLDYEYKNLYEDERSYYLELYNGDFYQVYKDKLDHQIYLFNNPNTKEVVASKGNIYYIINDIIYRYDGFGTKELIKYNELKYNYKNIFTAYNN